MLSDESELSTDSYAKWKKIQLPEGHKGGYSSVVYDNMCDYPINLLENSWLR